MEKHELDALIKRRFDEGKTLSLRKIFDEPRTQDTIKYWAVAHYGSWTEAKKSIIPENKRGLLFSDITKERLDSILLDMYDNGHSMKTVDTPSVIYRKACEFYGGYVVAKKSLGIMTKKEPSLKRYAMPDEQLDTLLIRISKSSVTIYDAYKTNRGLQSTLKRRYGTVTHAEKSLGIKFYKKERYKPTPKNNDEDLRDFISEVVRQGISGATAKEQNSVKFYGCVTRWGTWNKALIANGFEPTRKSPRKDWTKDEIKQIYLAEIQSGVGRENVSNTHAIRKHYGGIAQLRAELGLGKSEEEEKTLLSRISIDCYMNQVLKMDVDNVNEQLLDELDVNLTHSIKHYYGSTSNYFSIIDIDRYKKPYTPFTWTKENVVWQLERWIREEYPVNYTAIQSRHKGIIVASRKLFGSYKKAFEYAGLNYDDYRVDTAMASRQGAEFEKVVAEILADIGIEYLREPSINGCHPDFVMGKHWVDAKLSEWTVSFADCATMHKYLPHCRRLTIVYLRKLKDETVRTNELGVDLIHVSELLKELTEEKAQYYQRKLDAIMDVLKENAA